jgi:hypothetical protein
VTQLGDTPDLVTRLIAALQAMQKHRLDIEAALWYSDYSYSFDDVVVRVMQGDLEVFIFEKSIILAEVDHAPQFNTFHLYLAGGDLEEILAQEDLMMNEARLRGCRYISIAGRRGWEAPLRKMGWTHKLSILKKEIT